MTEGNQGIKPLVPFFNLKKESLSVRRGSDEARRLDMIQVADDVSTVLDDEGVTQDPKSSCVSHFFDSDRACVDDGSANLNKTLQLLVVTRIPLRTPSIMFDQLDEWWRRDALGILHGLKVNERNEQRTGDKVTFQLRTSFVRNLVITIRTLALDRR